MNSKVNKLLSVSALTILVSLASSTRAHAQNPARALEGTWLVQLTFRNCADGTVLRSGFGLNTFMQGGTMLGTPSSPVAAVRTGHGVWQHVGGSRFFSRMGLWAYDTQTGALLGIRVVSRNIDVGPGSDEFTASDTEQVYDPTTLAPIGAQACITGVGRRIS
jgi:hypothetical protein